MSKRIKAEETDSTVPALSNPDLEAPDVAVPSAPKGTKLEAILTLRKRGFSLAECGKQLGVSKQAVGQLLRRSGVDVEAVEQYKRDKPLLLNAVQKRVLDSIDSKVIAKMSGRDRFIALGITQDKIADLENPAHGGISANLWVNIVAQAHKLPEKDVTPPAEEVEA